MAKIRIINTPNKESNLFAFAGDLNEDYIPLKQNKIGATIPIGYTSFVPANDDSGAYRIGLYTDQGNYYGSADASVQDMPTIYAPRITTPEQHEYLEVYKALHGGKSPYQIEDELQQDFIELHPDFNVPTDENGNLILNRNQETITEAPKLNLFQQSAHDYMKDWYLGTNGGKMAPQYSLPGAVIGGALAEGATSSLPEIGSAVSPYVVPALQTLGEATGLLGSEVTGLSGAIPAVQAALATPTGQTIMGATNLGFGVLGAKELPEDVKQGNVGGIAMDLLGIGIPASAALSNTVKAVPKVVEGIGEGIEAMKNYNFADALSKYGRNAKRKVLNNINARSRIERALDTANDKYANQLNTVTRDIWAGKDEMREIFEQLQQAKKELNVAANAKNNALMAAKSAKVNELKAKLNDFKRLKEDELMEGFASKTPEEQKIIAEQIDELNNMFNVDRPTIDFSKFSNEDLLKFTLANSDYVDPYYTRINLSRNFVGGSKAAQNAQWVQDERALGHTTEDMLNKLWYGTTGAADFTDNTLNASRGISIFDNGSGIGFKVGDYEVPLFGTDDVIRGTIEGTNPGVIEGYNLSDYFNNTRYNGKYGYLATDWEKIPNIGIGTTEYSAYVPDEYVKALRKNIDWLKQEFPGAKEFGSSATAAYAGTPHSTHDIDLIMSDTDFMKYVESKLGPRTGSNWKMTRPNDTFTTHLDAKYGEAGSLDFNVIWTDSTTGMADANKGTLGKELFKQFFPEDYANAVKESMRTGEPLKINKTPQELIDAYDPTTKTILDSFSSNKAKHLPRAEAHLTATDPNYVEKALTLFANEKLGGQYKPLPLTRDMFTDVETNGKIFDELGYKGVDRATVIKDPAKMKNLVDYWYINNGIYARGVTNTVDTSHIPPELIEDLMSQGMTEKEAIAKAVDNAMRGWLDGRGGSARGAGLNAVTIGDSSHGNIYGYMQPNIQATGDNAIDIINSAKKAMGYHNYKFNDTEIAQIEEILGTEFKGNTPEQLLDQIPKTQEGQEMLQKLRDEMGITALQRAGDYGNKGARYTSMTGTLTEDDAVFYDYKRQMEIPVSGAARDNSIYIDASDSIRDLENKLNQLSRNYTSKSIQQAIEKSKYGKERKELLDQLNHFKNLKINFEKVTNKTKVNNPALVKAIESAEAKYNRMQEEMNKLYKLESQLRDQLGYNGRIGHLQSLQRQLDRTRRDIRQNLINFAIIGGALGLAGSLIIPSVVHSSKIKSAINEAKEINSELLEQKKNGQLTEDQYTQKLFELSEKLANKYDSIDNDYFMETGYSRLSKERKIKSAKFDIEFEED